MSFKSWLNERILGGGVGYKTKHAISPKRTRRNKLRGVGYTRKSAAISKSRKKMAKKSRRINRKNS